MAAKSKKTLESAAASAETFTAATKVTSEAAAKNYDKAVALTRDQVAKASALLEDFATLGKGNLDAVVEANAVIAKGLEQMTREFVSYAQASLESAASATKALFGAKTLQDVIALNNDYAKVSLDSFIANSTKLGDMGMKVANEALEPISQRVNLTIEKLAKPAHAA
jgi:phasin family protein